MQTTLFYFTFFLGGRFTPASVESEHALVSRRTPVVGKQSLRANTYVVCMLHACMAQLATNALSPLRRHAICLFSFRLCCECLRVMQTAMTVLLIAYDFLASLLVKKKKTILVTNNLFASSACFLLLLLLLLFSPLRLLVLCLVLYDSICNYCLFSLYRLFRENY